MAIQKTEQPYEFLIRWRDGKISGAHVKFLERLEEDGVVLAEKEGLALPVAVAGSQGFPIEDIFSAIEAGAAATAKIAIEAVAEAEQKMTEAIAAQERYSVAANAAEMEAARLESAVARKNAAQLELTKAEGAA